MRRPHTLTPELEHAVERNAHLVVLLRHLIRDLHDAGGAEHRRGAWIECPHPLCTKVKATIEAQA